MRDRRQVRSFVWGAILVSVGTWFLLTRLGFDLPEMDQLWPIFPLFCGLGSMIAFATREKKDPGLIFPGTLLVLLALFFFCFTFDLFSWDRMEVLWPIFPLIVGIAFVFRWFAGRCRELPLLVPGGITLSVGVIGLFFTLGDMTIEGLQLAGSLLVVALGAAIVLRSLRRTSD